MERIADLIDHKLLQAPAGYVLWFIDDEGDLCWQAPVIGWVIERRRCADNESYFWSQTPISAEEIPDVSQSWCVQFPDGRVSFPEDRICNTLDEARQHARELAASIAASIARARRSKEKAP